MAKLILDNNEYEAFKMKLLKRFSNIDFENNPFHNRYNYFIGFEFEFIYHKLFFDGLKQFIYNISNDSVVFFTIDPSPEEYFYKHFKKYSVFEISIIATDEELNEVMVQDPGESSADSIVTSSDKIAWFSESKDWAILASRDWEIAVVGFTNLEIKQKFIESFSEDAKKMFTTVEMQAKILDEMLDFNLDKKTAYQNLVHNYRDRKKF